MDRVKRALLALNLVCVDDEPPSFVLTGSISSFFGRTLGSLTYTMISKLTPEGTLLRQGAGDFRQPFPPREENANTPTIVAGTVAKTLRTE